MPDRYEQIAERILSEIHGIEKPAPPEPEPEAGQEPNPMPRGYDPNETIVLTIPAKEIFQ